MKSVWVIYMGYIIFFINYMVGVKYISYSTPTMSDNIILTSLCFDWHSGIMFVP